ncbi:MAG: Ig-like domain-containing protein, partial [Bacteroidota bacterium]
MGRHSQNIQPSLHPYYTLIICNIVLFIFTGCNDPNSPELSESLARNNLTPLEVIETTPPDGAQDIELNTYIQALFNTTLDSASITDSTFIIQEGTTTVEGSFSHNDSALTFYPSNRFQRDQTIIATVSSEIADTQGTTLNQNFEWSFTTRPPTTEERTPPTVSTTNPPHGATDISPQTDITAHFNKPLNPKTINSNSFLLQLGSSIISGSVDYDDDTAVFDPSGLLREGETYTVTITDDVQDLYGNPLTNTQNWNFTIKKPDRTPPRIISTNPDNNGDDVPVNIQITATFSEAMDQATINRETFTLYERHRGKFRKISGTVNYSGTTAQFKPSSNLRDDKDYIAVISANVSDLSGNALGDSYRWSFETDDDD